MSTIPLRLQFLFEKYVANSCSPDELEEFWRLMSELSENDLESLNLQNIWPTANSQSLEGEKKGWKIAYNRLQHRIEAHRVNYAKILPSNRRRMIQFAAAASILICMFASAWMFYFASSGKNKNQHIQNVSAYQTIHLPDGTIVTLNKQSKISYPVAFDGATREVFLTGEAFFDVAHNDQQPFLVHTGALVTKVLGTAFNIKAYLADENVSVTVTKGKVRVQKQNKDKMPLGVLLPGDQLVVNKTSEKAVLKKVDVGAVTEWKNEVLKLENVTFEQAAKLIGNHYNVSFQFSNEALRNCRFTGDFSKENLNHVLDIICTLTNSSWKKEINGTIQIDGKGCY